MLDLMNYNCFPEVYELQKFKEHSYLVMEKFDHTLHDHYITKDKKFTLETIALLS